MGQMDTYFLFLETWKLKCSSDEAGLRFVAYFHAGTNSQGRTERERRGERTEDAWSLRRDCDPHLLSDGGRGLIGRTLLQERGRGNESGRRGMCWKCAGVCPWRRECRQS